MAQAREDKAERIGAGQAAGMLMETAQQASSGRLDDRSSNGDLTAMNLQLFNNACIMAKSMKSFILNVSLNGQFWNEMDLALNSSDIMKSKIDQQPDYYLLESHLKDPRALSAIALILEEACTRRSLRQISLRSSSSAGFVWVT